MSTHAVASAPSRSLAVRSATNKWAIAVAVSLGALLEIIDTSIVNVATTDIQASLGTTMTEVSWVVSGYAIANVVILPLAAWLGHRFGKKSYFVFSLVGFTIASVLCGMATTFPMLVVARVLQGLMGGGLMAKAQAILFETFPKEEQAMAQGLFGAIVIAGPAIGPTLGGYLVTNVGWRWIFFVNVPVGILAVLMSLAFLADDEGPRERSPIDWTAIALLAVGLGAFQTVLEEGETDDWLESRFIVAMIAAAVAGLVLFVARQLRSKAPVVDLRVLRYRSVWAGSVLSLVVGMALYGALFAVPLFAGGILRYTSQQVGLLLLPAAIASALAMPVAARLVARVDPRALIAAGALVMVSGLWMMTHLSPQTSGDDLYWPQIVRGFGTVFMFLPLQLAALGPVAKEEVAAASGFFNLTRQLGGSIGVALLTTLVDKREAFHGAVVAEKLAAGDPHTLDRLQTLTQAMLSKGAALADAQSRALALLDGIARQQAAVMAFGDTFGATTVLVLAALPLVLLLGKAQRGMGPIAGH
jgi:DHA2 family multidrug resistance protein